MACYCRITTTDPTPVLLKQHDKSSVKILFTPFSQDFKTCRICHRNVYSAQWDRVAAASFEKQISVKVSKTLFLGREPLKHISQELPGTSSYSCNETSVRPPYSLDTAFPDHGVSFSPKNSLNGQIFVIRKKNTPEYWFLQTRFTLSIAKISTYRTKTCFK